MTSIKKILYLFLRILAGIWTFGLLLSVSLWILVYHGWFALDSKFMAISYYPPYAFIFFLIPPVLVFGITRNIRISFLMLTVYVIFLFAYDDFSFLKSNAPEFDESTKTQSISAAALNVRYYSFGLEKIIETIQSIDADLYLLSENEITPAQLEKLTTEIAPKKFFMGQQEGTAIISRYPIVEFKEVLLPSHQASLHYKNKVEKQHLKPRRSFVHAIVDVNGVSINAISVRFIAGRAKSRKPSDRLKWGFYVLESQVKELQFFQQYIEKLEGPVIFGGDLNATPSSFVVRRLSENATDAYLADHFWGGFTFRTIELSIAFARLDYLFCANQIKPVRSKRLNMVISDHYPLYAEFLIPSN